MWILPLLYVAGAIGEISDNYLFERENREAPGEIVAAAWKPGRRGGRYLDLQVLYTHEQKRYEKAFRLPLEPGLKYLDDQGKVLQPTIPVRYATAKPEVAHLAEVPPDPAWIGIPLAAVGLAVMLGVGWFMYQNHWKPAR